MVGAGAEIFEKLELEPEPHKNGRAPHHCSSTATALRAAKRQTNQNQDKFNCRSGRLLTLLRS
jgi:hypothetical protein